MKKIFLSSLIFASTMAFTGIAQARGGGSGILLDLNLYYGSVKVDDVNSGVTTHQSDSASAIYDIKLGYLMGEGLYLGGIYTSRSESALNASGTSGSATGASLGYMGSGGFFLMGHYLLSATEGAYKNGTGLQVDLGYKAGVSSGWLVGGELTYRSITYKKNATLSSAFEAREVTEVLPLVSVGYIF
ncbi:MAG TPA: hypothetical protein VIG33_04595 [Pseudobdellovibrionaceae bacterium]|jgi:hypothetical protein